MYALTTVRYRCVCYWFVTPLWTDHHLAYQQALNTAQRQYSQAQISHLNPFLAIRRPADYA